MPLPLLATKLYVPPPRPQVVRRSRLIERLNAGLHGKLTLISAPAGFGKTTLVSAWVAGSLFVAGQFTRLALPYPPGLRVRYEIRFTS